ncbi:BON domain-containing protein [Rhizobium binxianense]
MVFRFGISEGSEDSFQSHAFAATRASVDSALHAAGDIDASGIIVTIQGSCIILEGFVRKAGDAERAVEIAESIVGRGQVLGRILRR